MLRYNFQPFNITGYNFTVQPWWWQTNLFKFTAGSCIVLLILLIPFFVYYKNKQQRSLRSNLKQLELKSIYAQLNPHFIFNALSSIQSLVNQDKIDKANHYLTEFSSLLRQSLSNNDKEMVPLNEEIKVLENYLNLEQLRFNFNYTIHLVPEIDGHTIDLPSLLLQPIIENAVKHGVSYLQNRGNIAIDFTSVKQDIIVTITDNGKGFNTSEAHAGRGLKLTEERITLLNQVLKTQAIHFYISSNIEGTVVHLIFKNWLP